MMKQNSEWQAGVTLNFNNEEEKTSMTLRQIVTLPEPILRRKAKPITKFDKKLQTLIDDMIETMRDAPGRWAGRAAGEHSRTVGCDRICRR